MVIYAVDVNVRSGDGSGVGSGHDTGVGVCVCGKINILFTSRYFDYLTANPQLLSVQPSKHSQRPVS
jgi:hypothetical protein